MKKLRNIFCSIVMRTMLDCGLVKSVRLDAGITADAEVRRATLKFVKDTLYSGLVQAGFPRQDGTGFIPWQINVQKVIERIESEWNLLRRDPNIGEIVWFTTTEQGDAKVAAMAGKKD